MNVLAFAASNSKNSINKKLVTYASGLLTGVTVDVIDINDFEMPIFSVDRENEFGIPDQAKRFYELIGEADALIIAYAEHNGSYTAAFKNLYDWTSRIDQKVYQGKPIVMLATSPGQGGAKNVLAAATVSAPHFGGEVKASMSVAKFHETFDPQEGLKDSEQQKLLEAAVKTLLA